MHLEDWNYRETIRKALSELADPSIEALGSSVRNILLQEFVDDTDVSLNLTDGDEPHFVLNFGNSESHFKNISLDSIYYCVYEKGQSEKQVQHTKAQIRAAKDVIVKMQSIVAELEASL
ncbi:hypothetical protein [Massilia sp. TN1-12]|uniref:hypothetical protein n=1 Tax=Massilia paldalensis TaxID=3377675 RepID=UPI00385133D9